MRIIKNQPFVVYHIENMLRRPICSAALSKYGRNWNANRHLRGRHFSSVSAFSYGQGFLGTLGNNVDPFRDEPYPKKVQSLESIPVVAADCGWGHSAFLTQDGKVILTGRFLDFRNTMRNINIRGGFPIIQSLMNSIANYLFHSDIAAQEFGCDQDNPFIHVVCSSSSLSAALTKNGQLYMIGSNSFGQCGTGKVSDIVDDFTPISLMDGAELVSCVSLGFEHAVVVSNLGNLFSWGRGDRGQLGLGDKSHYRSPIRVLGKNQEWLDPTSEVLFVACESGVSKSAAIDSEGGLWVWGKMMSDQPGLKRGDGYVMQDQIHPRKVQFRSVYDVIHVPIPGDFLRDSSEIYEAQDANGDSASSVAPSETQESCQLEDIESKRRARWEQAMSERILPSNFPSTAPFTRADQVPNDKAIRIGPDARSIADIPHNYSPDVVMVTAGHAHYSFLTRDGRIWMIGLRGRGVLYDESDNFAPICSLGDRGSMKSNTSHMDPESIDQSKDRGVQSSDKAEGEVDDSVPSVESQPSIPEVYSQVTPLYIPPGPLEGKEVVGLRSSLHYSYAITKDGEVYRWGWKGIVTLDPELNGLDVKFGPNDQMLRGSGKRVAVKDVNFGCYHAVGVGLVHHPDPKLQ